MLKVFQLFQRKKKIREPISSFRLIVFGFLLLILLGTLFLMLPISASSGKWTSFADAAFTSTSAVCVTGLVVQDTATYWSFFGQLVILLLIQVGGMGVVTIAAAIAIFSGRKIGIRERSTMQDALSAPQVGGIVRMTGFILRTSLFIELAGALLLAIRFVPEFGLKGIWYSIFHSVSAFCNAGFDLMGIKENFSSLTSYASDPLVNIVIMILIISGGIGFLTWDDIKTNKWHFKKYRMQSKVILMITAVLIIFPAIFFFFYQFSEFPLGERILYSLFQSVTARTAGFNTVNSELLTQPVLMVLIMLMIIGGSPGSTAGGIKTTTIGVLFSSALSVFRRKESPQFFSRRISDSSVKNAAAIFLMYINLCLVGSITISCIEEIPMMSAVFETASAIGTVGLTLGITPSLSIVSRVILMFLMFFGRVGGMTLIFAAVSKMNVAASKYPQEKITIG